MGWVKRFVLGQPALAMAWIVSLLLMIAYLKSFFLTGGIANDFTVYWRTANGPVDLAYAERVEYPFPYAPTMLLWIKPLAFLPKWGAYFAYLTGSIAVLVIALRPYLRRSATLLVLVSTPLVHAWATGQVTVPLAAAMMWACGTDRRLLAGVALGLVATIKPQLVALAPLFLLFARDWKAIAGSAASFLAAVIASVISFGADIWFVWIASFDHFKHYLVEERLIGNVITLAGTAERWGFEPMHFLLVGFFFGAWLAWSFRHHGPVEKCAAIAVASLCAAPYAFTYDLAPIVPFLVMAIYCNRIGAMLAISGIYPPLQMLLSVYELLRSRWDARSGLSLAERKFGHEQCVS